MKQYDAIIIGFGKGGKTLAAELAKRNEKVAVIERSDEMYGGTCINIGCIPTKTLVHQAKLAPVKASWEEKKAYYAQAIAEKEEVTSFLRQKNYHNLADNPHITVYTGIGSFVSTDVVEVVMHDEILQLQAPRIYINTGAETIIPPIDGVKDNPLVYTSTSGVVTRKDNVPNVIIIAKPAPIKPIFGEKIPKKVRMPMVIIKMPNP
jgi:probable pyridine nucleotide-disulfide oxidoreductase